MAYIRPSADLRNSYNEISDYCHECGKPVYITKNGRGDLVVMSVEAYEKLSAKFELYEMVYEGIKETDSAECIAADRFISDLREMVSVWRKENGIEK
ncbi:MAG: type II toxin-antitoxin system Phd/YefM family antitoxin [Clostridiales bacterium]|nr:type II toxin-antitoxin system Phd/YefM family antitoxin [Clostridiales bacterium]